MNQQNTFLMCPHHVLNCFYLTFQKYMIAKYNYHTKIYIIELFVKVIVHPKIQIL